MINNEEWAANYLFENGQVDDNYDEQMVQEESRAEVQLQNQDVFEDYEDYHLNLDSQSQPAPESNPPSQPNQPDSDMPADPEPKAEDKKNDDKPGDDNDKKDDEEGSSL